MITEKPVCVTGASGFIATHIVKQLLDKGYKVKGTVRSLKDRSKYSYLDNLPGADERLELIEAELLKDGSYDEAVKNCEYVIHTASPYMIDVKDAQKDLVDPAVKGTVNVLRSCNEVSSIKRVILTSSFAAISDEPGNDKVFSEEDWNKKSNLNRNPYYYSKTMAEMAGWEFINKQKPSFDLVTINPAMVIGPSLGSSLNNSNKILIDMMTGRFPGIINLNWGFVDVRDVASAHILAIENSKARGRYLCANESLTMKGVVEFLHNGNYSHYKLPKLDLTSVFGNKLIYLFSYFQSKGSGSYLRSHIGRTIKFNHSKIKKELGIKFISFEKSILETIPDLIYWGHLEKIII
jgi:nucleoside-diphosphate-sugar epimerase